MEDETESQPKFPFHLNLYANALKTTVPQNFEKIKRLVPEEVGTRLVQTRKILVELFRQTDVSYQNKDMDAVPQRSTVTQEAIDAAVAEYLSLIQAIFRNENLKTMEVFQWSNLVMDKEKTHQGDALFEAMCVLLNYALWYQAEGCKVLQSVTPENFEEPHKQAYKLLLKAVSIYDRIIAESAPLASIGNLLDFQEGILRSRRTEALCQAQQVTIARGVIKGTSHSLLSRLALDLSNKYSDVYQGLHTYDFPRLPNSGITKWRFAIKNEQAVSDAMCCIFQAKTLMNEKKCGDAVFLCQYALDTLNQNAIPAFESFCDKPPKTNMKSVVDRMKLFREYVEQTLRTAKRDNELVYFENVPKERPKVPEPQSLIKLEEYKLPEIHPSVHGLESYTPPVAQPEPPQYTPTPSEATPAPNSGESKPQKAKDECAIC